MVKNKKSYLESFLVVATNSEGAYVFAFLGARDVFHIKQKTPSLLIYSNEVNGALGGEVYADVKPSFEEPRCCTASAQAPFSCRLSSSDSAILELLRFVAPVAPALSDSPGEQFDTGEVSH